MRVPKKTSSRYDLLDSLADGQVWTFTGLMDDTGRSMRSCLSVLRRMEGEGLLCWQRRRQGQPTSAISITRAGRLWLWCVNRDLPGQNAQLLMMLLETLETGPMLTTQVPGTVNGKAMNSIKALRRCSLVRMEMQRTGDRVKPSRLQITDAGRALLDSYREAFDD